MSDFYYKVFGLNIKCPFECPLLQAGTAKEVDVSIEFDQHLRDSLLRPNRFLLDIKNIALYLIEDGNKIRIEAVEAAPLNEIQLFLFGSAMGSLLHQRELLVLHGCAVEFLEGIVVFVAHSGTGKSTLASCFYQNGFNVFCDDQSVIDVNRGLLVSPGLGQIKLWREALEGQGLQYGGLQKVYKEQEKYIFPINKQILTSKPLIAVVELEKGPEYLFKPLMGKSKMETLITHTYRNEYLVGMGLLKQHFSLYDKVANTIFVARATRPEKTNSSRDFFEFILQQLKLQGIHAASQCVKIYE